MNANAIKASLNLVHRTEKSSTNPNGLSRVKAIEQAIVNGPVLTHAEVDVLLRSLNVSRYELTVQFG